MVWLAIPLLLVGTYGAFRLGSAALGSLVKAIPDPTPQRGLPRAPEAWELLGGVAVMGGAVALAVAPGTNDFYPLTPIAVGVVVLVGALVAAGPRGRARIGAFLFTSNRQYLDGRRYILTYARDRRLAELGRAVAPVVLLLVGTLVALAVPGLRELESAPSLGEVRSDLPPGMRAELEAAIATGDPDALAAARALGLVPTASSPALDLDAWTAERHLGWTLTALVLALLALVLVLSPGGLSVPPAERAAS